MFSRVHRRAGYSRAIQAFRARWHPRVGTTLRRGSAWRIHSATMTACSARFWANPVAQVFAPDGASSTARLKAPRTSMKLATRHSETTRGKTSRHLLLRLRTAPRDQSITNFFPVTQPPLYFSAKNPASGPPFDTLPDFFSAFGTIGSSPAFNNKNRLPYAEEYELSIEHQLTRSDLLTVSYVGTQAHRLLASESANPGVPATCLAVAQGCGPGGENNIYINGGTGAFTLGTRAPFSGVQVPGTTVFPCAPGCVTALPNGNSESSPSATTRISSQLDLRLTIRCRLAGSIPADACSR